MNQTLQTLIDCGPIGLVFLVALAAIAFVATFCVIDFVKWAFIFTACPLCGCRAKKVDDMIECDRCGSMPSSFA